MKTNFKKALALVLVHEGGKVDHPKDPGGRTNQGVIQRVYNDYRKSKGLKPRDVYTMTPAERDEIYRRRYWDVIDGDELPAGVDFVVFDGAVNSGPTQSVKWLQRALGHYYQGRIDGQLGMSTLEAVREHPDHDALVSAICARRMAFLRALKTWPTFGRGWTRRVDGVEATGRAWATGGKALPVKFIPEGEAKARIEDMRPLPVKAAADATAGVGGGLAATSQLVEQSKAQLGEFGHIEIIQKILLVLTIAGIVLFVGGIAYRWFARRREKAMIDALDLNPNVVRE